MITFRRRPSCTLWFSHLVLEIKQNLNSSSWVLCSQEAPFGIALVSINSREKDYSVAAMLGPKMDMELIACNLGASWIMFMSISFLIHFQNSRAGQWTNTFIYCKLAEVSCLTPVLSMISVPLVCSKGNICLLKCSFQCYSTWAMALTTNSSLSLWITRCLRPDMTHPCLSHNM